MYIKSKNDREEKGWICLITCCVTRAVHLEVVPNLTTEAFLRVLRRFIARRSTPLLVVSDNAKTFKAASKELTALMKDPQVKQYFVQQRIQWSFNLEKAPWWGGFFERLVGLLKRFLKKTIGKSRLSYEGLVTVVTEAEIILNCRPLSYVSSEDIEEPLTPAHLMMGKRIVSWPDRQREYYEDEDFEIPLSIEDLSERMQRLNKVLTQFWQRWRSEYLVELRSAHNNKQKSGDRTSVGVGDVVLVHDEDHPRNFWRIGRVECLIVNTESDGKPRGAVVQVMSKGGKITKLRRPLQLLYPMEINGEISAKENQLKDSEVSVEDKPKEAPRPRRQAAIAGEQKVKQWIRDMNKE